MPLEPLPWIKPVGTAIGKKLLRVDGIRSCVALGTDNLAQLPGALVLVPALRNMGRSGNAEQWQADYPIVIVQGVLKTVDQTLASMVELVDRIIISWWDEIQLGLEYVIESAPTEFEPELFDLAGKTYPSYRGAIRVMIKQFRATPRTA